MYVIFWCTRSIFKLDLLLRQDYNVGYSVPNRQPRRPETTKPIGKFTAQLWCSRLDMTLRVGGSLPPACWTFGTVCLAS